MPTIMARVDLLGQVTSAGGNNYHYEITCIGIITPLNFI